MNFTTETRRARRYTEKGRPEKFTAENAEITEKKRRRT
jgi:hypothetical protein